MNIFLKSVFFTILTLYLVGIGFLLPSINTILNPNNPITYNSFDKNIEQSGQAQHVTLISTISDLPLWFNVMFIGIPFIMWCIVLVIMFLPN